MGDVLMRLTGSLDMGEGSDNDVWIKFDGGWIVSAISTRQPDPAGTRAGLRTDKGETGQ